MKRLLVTFMLVTLVFATPVQALNIAVLDAQTVMNESKAAKRAVEKIKIERDKAQSKIKKLEGPLLEKKKRLEDQKSVLNREDFAEKQNELRKAYRKFKSEGQSIKDALDLKYLKFRQEITDATRTAVQEISKEKKYDIVLPKHVLYFTNDEIDITDEVLKRVNKKLK